MANPTSVTQYQTAVAPELAPYVQQMLGVQAGRTYQYAKDEKGNPILDASGMPQITGFQAAPVYGGERNAAYSGLQKTSYGAAQDLGLNTSSQNAAYGLQSLADQASKTAYTPGEFNQQTINAPSLQNYQMQAPAAVQGAQAQAAQTGYQPSLQSYQMGPAQQVRTQDFNAPGAAQSYMSPYMQSVVNQQQQDAIRQANIQNTSIGAQAARAGSLGGGRQAIEQAQANRALQTQLGNIQAQGLQNAYTQGQQQFNAQQQAALQAQQANQQAGLTTGQANLNAALGVQGLGAQYGAQMALANLGNAQQANLQNAQLTQQANLANQQVGLTAGQANLNALLGVQSLGAGQNLAAQQANQQTNLATQQAQQQANQFGANLGLQGLQTGMTGYSALGAQGQNLYNQNVGNITLQNQLGTQQQQNAQNILNTGYQDWLTQQQYPQQQMDTLQSYIRGTPLNTVGSSTTTAAPSAVSQIAGLGTAAAGAYGMYNSLNKKKGGAIKAKKEAGGLEALALSKLA